MSNRSVLARLTSPLTLKLVFILTSSYWQDTMWVIVTDTFTHAYLIADHKNNQLKRDHLLKSSETKKGQIATALTGWSTVMLNRDLYSTTTKCVYFTLSEICTNDSLPLAFLSLGSSPPRAIVHGSGQVSGGRRDWRRTGWGCHVLLTLRHAALCTPSFSPLQGANAELWRLFFQR